jgi:hypothetical protein
MSASAHEILVDARGLEPPEPMENKAAALFTKLARIGTCPEPIEIASM